MNSCTLTNFGLLDIACLDPIEFGSGVYQARALMDWNGFCSVNSAKSMTLEDEENSEYSDKQIILYPNPNNGSFTITTDKEIGRIEIFQLNGRSVKVFEKLKTTEAEINLSLEPGIYLIRIELLNGTLEEKRIVIQ